MQKSKLTLAVMGALFAMSANAGTYVLQANKWGATQEAADVALDAWRLRRVVTAAERLAPRYLKPGHDVRIDAIFIVPGRVPRHVPNVWHA